MTNQFHQSPRAARRVMRAVVEVLEARQLLSGTLRIVNYNIDADTSDFTNQGGYLETVLEAIGNKALSDNGVSNSQPIDVLAVEELQNGSGTTGAPTLASIVAALNVTYGTGTYAYDTTTDPTDAGGTGNGPSGLIYNTHTVQDLGAVALGSPSSSGAPRDPMQYHLQPIGYTSAAAFYVDVSHAKSGTGSSNSGRRAIEATTIVNSLNALGANAHVIALGDFNITGNAAEQTYQTLRLKFDDPANPAGNWASSSAFANLLSESATNVEFRDDIQFATPAADSGSSSPGLQLDQGSLSVFGNGGATSIFHARVDNQTANSGVFPDFTSAYRATVLTALENDTDHLPVVADYSIVGLAGLNTPQIGSLSVNPTSVFQGSTVTVTAANVSESGGTISSVKFYLESNNSPGLQVGSDTLVGSGTESGNNWSVTSATGGLTAGTHTFYAVATDTSNTSSIAASTTLNVATPPPYVTFSNGAVYTWNATTGDLNVASGTVTFIADQASSGDTTDPLVNLTAAGAGSTVVFNTDEHITGLTLNGGATASILPGAAAIVDMTALSIDATSAFDITNNSITVDFASPAVDPVTTIAGYLATGYNGGAWTGLGLFSSSAAANPGKFSVGYADGNVDAGTGTPANEIRVKYTLGGNANLDGSVGFDDLVPLAQNFGGSGKDWAQGDFHYDPNGSVGFDDLVLVAQNFGAIGGASVSPPTGTLAVSGQVAEVHVEPTATALQPTAAANIVSTDAIDTVLHRGRRRRILG